MRKLTRLQHGEGCVDGCARSTKWRTRGRRATPTGICIRYWGWFNWLLARATSRGRMHECLSESPVPEIGSPDSMSGRWKRSSGEGTRAPPDERGGQRTTWTYDYRATSRLYIPPRSPFIATSRQRASSQQPADLTRGRGRAPLGRRRLYQKFTCVENCTRLASALWPF
jgi:hypothetical protein